MNREYRLGTFAGLHWSAVPSAVGAVGLLWVVGSGAAGLLGVPLAAAIGVGGAVVAVHWLSEGWHQLGHAAAARQVGHPMQGVRFWGLLSASVYPDEPPLPAAIHIRRALGGPAASGLLALVAGVGALALLAGGGVFFGLALFFFLENLLVFFLGSFLPLGFNDGSTLLHWWGKS